VGCYLTDFIEIPQEQLSAELKRAVIEDFITREGTDYGHRDFTLDEKVAQIQKQLDSSEICIAFDDVTETCTLIVKT
jgi:uncharacterized protein YheU (UPF0270 family)